MDINVPNAMKSYLRLLHASPLSPSVDVYINSIPTVRDLRYKGFTEYLPIAQGSYNVKLFKAGTANLIFNTDIKIAPNQIETLCVIGKDPADLSLFQVRDPKLLVDTTKAYLRIVQLSPNIPSIDVVTSNNITLFTDVSYKEKQGYVSLNPSIYALDFNLADTTTSVLYVPNIKLKANKFYTLYVVGLLNDTPPLQVLIPLDGNSYITFFNGQ